MDLESIIVQSDRVQNRVDVNQEENNHDPPIQIKEKNGNGYFNKDNYKNDRSVLNPTNSHSFDEPDSHFKLEYNDELYGDHKEKNNQILIIENNNHNEENKNNGIKKENKSTYINIHNATSIIRLFQIFISSHNNYILSMVI